jgi:2-desacetyl-2-hydroxyethyl bacteriochlorophyllide A dehydrogenase
MLKAHAVIFPAAEQVALDEILLPDPGPEDVVVETEFSGISNGTEGWILMARYTGTRFPLVTGYQKVGVISHAGAGVKGYKVGERVFLRATRVAQDINGMWYGHTSRSVSDYRALIPVPAQADPAEASLLVMVAVGFHGACELVDVQAGDLAVVIGQGLIGQFAAQACKNHGCTVVTVEPLPERRRLSAELGADHAVDPTAQDPWEVISAIKAAGADAIVDTSAVASVINQSFTWLRQAGKYCFQAYYPDTTALDMLWPHIRELVMYNPTNVTEDGMKLMMMWMACGMAKVRPLISHLRPWTDAPELFMMMIRRPQDCLGMVLDWTELL